MRKMKKIVVVGGGVLGSQIAYQSAFKGFDVTIWLRSPASVERAKPKLARWHETYRQELAALRPLIGHDIPTWPRGLVSDFSSMTTKQLETLERAADLAYENLRLETDMSAAFSDADLVIESLSEDAAAKIEFYQKAAALLPEKTILATNTSTMLPSMLAGYTGRPEKYLALHFANMIWRNNTAEIMGHPGTEQIYYDTVAAFAADIGMIPLLLKKEQPGYILNSMLVPFLASAEALLANEVADVQTIDRTWMLATGSPLGPFRILDIVGLDTAYHIAASHPGADDPETTQGRIAAMLKSYIDAGKKGVSSGEGFYQYKA